MSKKIMIVNDSNFARKLIKNIHEIIGKFESGGLSVEEYSSLKPDLGTMDIIMHEMNALEALDKILSIDPDARIIIVSFMNDKESIIYSLPAGAVDFVTKPFSRECLLDAVKKLYPVLIKLETKQTLRLSGGLNFYWLVGLGLSQRSPLYIKILTNCLNMLILS